MKKNLICKTLLLSLLILFFLFIPSFKVKADMRPKPASHVEIMGIEGKYTAAFVFKGEILGPNLTYERWLKEDEKYRLKYNPIMKYSDSDGFK